MNAVLRLIEKQAAMRGIQDRLETVEDVPGRFVQDGVAYGPCLLMSRESASGGARVARLVAERLGWSVFDSELVDEVARVAHERQRLIASMDERVVSTWERTWRDLLLQTGAADAKYLHCLREVILSIGHHGSAVIVGRGAQYLLPPQCAVRARLVAPVEFRAKIAAECGQISLPDARAKVQAADTAREAFIWKTFHARSDLPLNYDLVINTAETGFRAASEIILGALAAKLGVHATAEPSRTLEGSDSSLPRSSG